MKLSINPYVIGKPVFQYTYQNEDGSTLVVQDRVNLGENWENIEVSWPDAFALITEDGFATSAELKGTRRREENFASRQLCMVDVDNGMTIYDLLDNDFYNKFGAGFYTTPSHRDIAHRFRIMFMLEQPETDAKRFRKITRGLLSMFECADQSCKDATRLYYGTSNCEIKEITDKTLPNEGVEEFIRMIDHTDDQYEKRQQSEFQQYYHDMPPYPVAVVDHLLSLIAQQESDLKGEYNTWRTIAWATCHAVGQTEARNLMMKHWPYKTKKESDALKSWRSERSPTVGTLIHLSKIDQTRLQEIEARSGYIRPAKILSPNEYKAHINLRKHRRR